MSKKTKKTNATEKFWNDMAQRPYPFNRPVAITAQALSPYSGLSKKEKMEFVLMNK